MLYSHWVSPRAPLNTHWGWTLLRSKACNKFQSWHEQNDEISWDYSSQLPNAIFAIYLSIYPSIYLSIYLYTWGWCFCSESHLKIARCGRYIITGSKYQPKQKDTGFSRYDSPNMRWFDTLSCHLWSPKGHDPSKFKCHKQKKWSVGPMSYASGDTRISPARQVL